MGQCSTGYCSQKYEFEIPIAPAEQTEETGISVLSNQAEKSRVQKIKKALTIQVTQSHIHGLNKLPKYNKPQCQLCKSEVETTPQKIKLSEKNDIILNTCTSCKLLTTYSKEQWVILNELDNYEENSLEYKIVQKYENNHSKTQITDRLAILSELVYDEKHPEVQKNMEKDEKIKYHFDNLKILLKNKHALMAVDNVKRHCYFAFRGTKLDASDFLNDIDIAITGDATSRIKEMDDFYDLNKKDYVEKKYEIFLTGHSLGGNVAEYLLMQNEEVTQCETFNAGNSFDFYPDFLDHLFENEKETTLQQLQKGISEGKSQEQIAEKLKISVDQLKERIQKAKNSDQNIQKDRQQSIIQHIIKGDPISLSKIHPYSQRFEVKTDKKLFAAHSLSNFLEMIDYPIDSEEKILKCNKINEIKLMIEGLNLQQLQEMDQELKKKLNVTKK